MDTRNIEEFDHLLSGDPAGLAVHRDGEALTDRISEWLETPEGTIADIPWWGNRLMGLKHEPQGVNLQVFAEMMIAEKLPLDVKNLELSGVSVESVEIDRVNVVIACKVGKFSGEVVL